ncbi:MAG: hypothetical protein ACKV2O_23185, partial [Acidimicrobiales bacterium]
EPRDPGDRGGWWQESLFFLMCGAVLFIGTLVWRDSRRARRRQGRLGPVTAAVATPGAHSEQLAVEPALERIVEPTVERAAGT